MIQENLQHEQAKLVKYNHLVTNLIILHNAMSKVVKRLKHKGVEITDDLLAGLPPYRGSHIILLGTYQLQTNKRAKSRQFKL